MLSKYRKLLSNGDYQDSIQNFQNVSFVDVVKKLKSIECVCLFVYMEFYGPITAIEVMSSRSVNRLTYFPDRLKPSERIFSTCTCTLFRPILSLNQ